MVGLLCQCHHCQAVPRSATGGAAVSLRLETHAYAAAGQTLRDTPWPAAVAPLPADVAVLAGVSAPPAPSSAAPLPAGLAANVSVLVSAQSSSYNALTLNVRGLPAVAPYTVRIVLIDAATAPGTSPAALQYAAQTSGSGALTVTLASFNPPTVARVQLLLLTSRT